MDEARAWAVVEAAADDALRRAKRLVELRAVTALDRQRAFVAALAAARLASLRAERAVRLVAAAPDPPAPLRQAAAVLADRAVVRSAAARDEGTALRRDLARVVAAAVAYESLRGDATTTAAARDDAERWRWLGFDPAVAAAVAVAFEEDD